MSSSFNTALNVLSFFVATAFSQVQDHLDGSVGVIALLVALVVIYYFYKAVWSVFWWAAKQVALIFLIQTVTKFSQKADIFVTVFDNVTEWHSRFSNITHVGL